MSKYSQVINYDLKGPRSDKLVEFIDSSNDYPVDLVAHPYLDGKDIVLDVDDDYIKIYEICGKPAIVAQLLELGKLGVTGYILTLDNWSELTRYDICECSVNEKWINIDNIQYEGSRHWDRN